MGKYFIPYADDLPAVVNIKGHRVIIVGSKEEDFLGELALIGGDELREIDLPLEALEQSTRLAELAADVSGGVVLSPPGVSPSVMIRDLEEQLPWVH